MLRPAAHAVRLVELGRVRGATSRAGTVMRLERGEAGMRTRAAVVCLGVGVTTFLAVTVAVTELASAAVEFSLFVGLPVGAIAGASAAVVTYLRVDAESDVFRGAAAAATFGYAVLWLLLVRYVVSATRSLLSVPTIAVLAVVAAVGTYAWLGRQ